MADKKLCTEINRSPITRDQLLTVADLENFKTDLLAEIRNLLTGFNGKPSAQWIKSKDVRKMLGISAGTLQHLRINGTLPFIKLGGTILYNYEDILTRLDEHAKQRV